MTQKLILCLTLFWGGQILASGSEVSRHSGIVLDTQRHPVANATVDIYHQVAGGEWLPSVLEFEGTVQSDDHGKFEFPVIEGNTVFVAHKPGLAPGWLEAYVKQWDVSVVLILGQPAEIAGVVVDDNGHPVAGAEVWASSLWSTPSLGNGRTGGGILTGRPARQLFSTRTAPDGQFHLAGVPADSGADLAVTKPGLAMREPKLDPDETNPFGTQCLAGQTNALLVMEPGANIHGKVVVEKTGNPLGGVTLWLRRSSASFSFYNGREPIKSAPDGTFHFDDVAAGSYTIIARDGRLVGSMPAWVAEPVQVTVRVRQDLSGIQISAVKGGVLEVTAVDQANGKPIRGVRIAADKRFYGAVTTTDTKGTAWIRLPAGAYNVSAMKDMWSIEERQAMVESGRTNQSRVDLSPPLTLRGTVFDPAGAPVTNCQVSIGAEDSSGGAHTDSHGRFDILWNPNGIASVGRTFLVARDWTENLATMTEIDPFTTNVSLQLQPGFTLSGLVTDKSGKPLSKARLELTLRSSTKTGSSSTTTTTDFASVPYQTDADGQFTYEDLPPGFDYGINISANGYGTAEQQVSATETKTNRIELRFALSVANLNLAGRVVDVEGKPLAGAELTVTGTSQPYRYAKTDADGFFEVKKLCAGEVQVGALYRGHFGTVSAETGVTNVIIKIATKAQ